MATTEHAFDGNGFCQVHSGYCSMAPAEPPAIPLDEALAPYLELAAERKAALEFGPVPPELGIDQAAYEAFCTAEIERLRADEGSEPALEDRLAELITADEPTDGLDVFARRMVSAWTAEAESGPAGEVGV